MKLIIGLLILLSITNVNNIHCQDLERITKAPWLVTNGGISVNQIGYNVNGKESYRKPYTYYLSGNINTNILGVVNLPFSFSYTNNDLTHRTPQPFNQFSLTPSYKWIKAHIGYASINLSPYTLNGHRFLGGGLELTPTSKLKFSMLYGEFQRAVKPDSANNFTPVYRRMGGGFRTEYNAKDFGISLALFKAKDDESSIDSKLISDSTDVKPQENLTVEIGTRANLGKHFRFGINYAVSALNQDTRDTIIKSSEADFLFKPRSNATYFDAIKTYFSYNSKIGSLGVQYERVDPGYKTFGTYYSTNDFENISLTFATAFAKNRVSVSGNIGAQKDNLEDQKSSSMSRMTSTVNVGLRPNNRLNATVSYSNLQSYTYIRPVLENYTSHTKYENLDTLNFTQITQSLGANINYILSKSKTKRQSIALNMNLQTTADKQKNKSVPGNDIFTGVTSYNISNTPASYSITTSVNYSNFQMESTKSETYGITTSLRKSFFNKRLKSSVVLSYVNSTANGVMLNKIFNTRIINTYTLKKKHNFSLNITLINNNGKTSKFTETSATLAYSYSFNYRVKRKRKK